MTAVGNISVENDANYMFANISKKDKDEIYPVTASKIADSQLRHRLYKN